MITILVVSYTVLVLAWVFSMAYAASRSLHCIPRRETDLIGVFLRTQLRNKPVARR